MRTIESLHLRTAVRGVVLLSGFVLLWSSAAALASPPKDADHVVGTLVEVDQASKRLSLADDAQTGSELGQGSPTNVYLDASTTASRDGKAAALTGLKLGERLLIRTARSGDRLHGSQIVVLPDTSMEQGPQRYLHGTVEQIKTDTRTLHIDQAQTLIPNLIAYDDQTTVVTLDGKTVAVTSLKQGDEIDASLRLRERLTTAKKIVLLRSAGGP
ncbi:hypothetical protein MNR01_00630 [Lysobacter sp. S4-A87]|uniref:hypothetical protein n=1 Tax=Lysobacter sp. S4-A87 TaxID=2925843 RepID=UPI001F53ADFA|nr:hypothetical protein [Lysobacter sp. S4-A87]UNK49587.1 hypothetical protein MNR01_00630 [Lysobacter sp. S4-A87]